METESDRLNQKESQESNEAVLEMLRTFLVTIGPVLLSPENLDLRQSFASALLIKESQDTLMKFLTGSEFPVLAIELLEDDLGNSLRTH
jgi:hypothetical protein